MTSFAPLRAMRLSEKRQAAKVAGKRAKARVFKNLFLLTIFRYNSETNMEMLSVYINGVNLKIAQFADLCGADLENANLQGANLQGADLRWANLQEADYGGRTSKKLTYGGLTFEKLILKEPIFAVLTF